MNVVQKKIIMRAAEQPDTHIIRPAVSPYVLLVAYLIVEQKIYLLLLKIVGAIPCTLDIFVKK